MLLSDETYDLLKWIAINVIPSLATFVGVVGMAAQWEYTALATVVITALGSLIAGCIGMSISAYEKAKREQYEGDEE